MEVYQTKTLQVLPKHKRNYGKANFKVNIYDIIWSFIQSEKLRLPQNIFKDIFVKHIEEDYKEKENGLNGV